VREKILEIDRDYVVRLLKKLIEIESVNPRVEGGTGEAEISNFIADHLESVGMEVYTQDVVDDRFNVIGILRGRGGGRSLMMNGHTDTVGVKGMTIEPFKPFIEDDHMHGRGACDMKGPLAGMIAAVKALVNSGVKLRGDLLISAVVDEEYESVGTERLIREYRSDAVIVGEPTNLQIGIAHKGFVWLEIETRGKAAHGSVPEKGIDAIAKMAKIISRLPRLEKAYAEKRHNLVGFPKIHTSMIEGGSEWSIVPDSCRLKLERRTVPGETSSMVVDELDRILDELSTEDPMLSAEIKKVFERPPMEIAPSEAIVKKLRLAVREIKRSEPRIVGEPFWTDAALFVNNAAIPACLFGPGDVGLAHSADEFIKISDVVDSAKIYALAAQTFCGI
jgi:acetylornithine deacetylase